MQGQNTSDSKVISIFENRSKAKKAEEGSPVDATAKTEQSPQFDEVMRQNQKNKERMEKERLNANKSVLRSYRIKH